MALAFPALTVVTEIITKLICCEIVLCNRCENRGFSFEGFELSLSLVATCLEGVFCHWPRTKMGAREPFKVTRRVHFSVLQSRWSSQKWSFKVALRD